MDLAYDSEDYSLDEGIYDSSFVDLDNGFQAKSRSDIPFAQSLNERPLGVRSNYDEDIYTTTVDRNHPQYAERAARAEKLAREIEHRSALDVNVDRDVVGDPVKNTTGNQETSIRSDTEETYVSGYRTTPNTYRSDHTTEASYPHEIDRFACYKCGKVFYEIRRLKEHIKTHSKPHKCRLCVKSFGTINDRDSHEKFHHKLYRPQQGKQTKENQSYDIQSMESASTLATSPVFSATRLQEETSVADLNRKSRIPIRSDINTKMMQEDRDNSAQAPKQSIKELESAFLQDALSGNLYGYKSSLSAATSTESVELSPEAGKSAIGDIPKTQDRAFSNISREEMDPQRNHPLSDQRSCEVFHVSEDESRNTVMVAPLLVGDTPDPAVGTITQETEPHANSRDKISEKTPSISDMGDTSTSVTQLPSSDHTLDSMEVTRQDDTSKAAVNTAYHPIPTVYNPSELWTSIRNSEFFNVIGRGFNQAVYPAKFGATILGLRESSIPPNSRRIRWTCTCSMCLYDDFIELVPGDLDDLQRKLDTGDSKRQHNNSNQGSSNGRSPGLGGLLSVFGLIPFIRARMNGKTTGAGHLPTHISSSTTTAVAGTGRSLYLLLCMKSGIFGTDLHHGQLQNVNCDRDLLKLLRTAYNERRSKLRSAISFRITNSISFIKFVADMNSNVDIHPHSIYCGKTDCICLPPQSKVEPEPNSEYSCNPIPARHIPPVGENYLMHLFSSPECIHPSQVWILNQIPKRTRGQLIARPDAPAEGWGLHFQEGWHWVKIMTVILTLFVGGSLVFGLVYAVLRKDVQTAFTVATYWFTASGVLLGYLAARSP